MDSMAALLCPKGAARQLIFRNWSAARVHEALRERRTACQSVAPDRKTDNLSESMCALLGGSLPSASRFNRPLLDADLGL